ncbi:MAG: hypothetical protein NT013_18695 [Planctomycetia bacterium]|nr:hypothetical protein [Planctomycetia bacterium]
MSDPHYTFLIPMTFEMQFTFPSKDVVLATFPDKGLPEYCPSDAALEELRAEIEECLGQNYAVDNVQIPSLLVTFLGSDDSAAG